MRGRQAKLQVVDNKKGDLLFGIPEQGDHGRFEQNDWRIVSDFFFFFILCVLSM